MSFTTALLSIMLIHLMASIYPGPDFVVVSQKTLFYGRKTGIFCGLGVCVGLLFHMSYSLAGLATVLKHSKHATQIIGICGGCYLIFLGYKAIKSSLSKQTKGHPKEEITQTAHSAFWNGLIVNVLNPKAAIYFISLFSIVISPTLSIYKILLVIATILIVQMSWYLIFVFVVTIPSIRSKFFSKIYFIDRIFEIFMTIMGIYLVINYALNNSVI